MSQVSGQFPGNTIPAEPDPKDPNQVQQNLDNYTFVSDGNGGGTMVPNKIPPSRIPGKDYDHGGVPAE
jgi:hypothetical protein